jgi:hypothetical protein
MWLTDLWLRTRRDGAATSARDAAASPVHDGPDSPARSTERRPGHFDAVADAAQRATVATGGSSPEPATRLTIDLSERPDPPVSWPPPAVQVPRVFQVSSTEALIVDLRSAPVAQPPTTQQPPAMPAAPPPPATQAQPDPWLAFAAAMFRDD